VRHAAFEIVRLDLETKDASSVQPVLDLVAAHADTAFVVNAGRAGGIHLARIKTVERAAARLRHAAVRMAGVVEELHLEPALPRGIGLLANAIEDAGIAARREAPLEKQAEIGERLAAHQADRLGAGNGAQRAAFHRPAFRREAVHAIAAPGAGIEEDRGHLGYDSA
jgi:hypothetical protein